MILDTSAIIAILRQEPEAAALARAIEASEGVRVSAATWVEASLVCGASRHRALDELLTAMGAVIEPVDEQQAKLARHAHVRYGRGSGSAARLNLGDCFTYALAAQAGEPLLFVGNGFAHTDLVSAIPLQQGAPDDAR